MNVFVFVFEFKKNMSNTINALSSRKIVFYQITDSVKFDLGLEIQFLLKRPFLTVFSQIYRPTKVDVLGTHEVSS